MATEATARKFFSSPFFAVVGASSNPAKYGHKIYAWYLLHDLNVTPINPGSSTIAVQGKEYAAIPNLAALPNPKETSVSLITPPAITVDALKQAKELGIPSVWMQPGSFNDDVLKVALADGAFQSVVYGDGGRGGEGWCVLVDGERALKDAGKL